MTTIGIVDYGMGNRRSVEKALEQVGARALLSNDAERLGESDGLIVPGVGAFPQAMHNLRLRGLDELIRARAAEGIPILGVCLGMQLIFDGSEEIVQTAGLGLIPGEVRWLQTGGLRIPHIGWNEVDFEQPTQLTRGLPERGCPFYHVHSLAPHPADAGDVVDCTEYGERFAAIVQRANVFGVQFHPEKSSAHGLKMLQNFVGICAEVADGVTLRA